MHTTTSPAVRRSLLGVGALLTAAALAVGPTVVASAEPAPRIGIGISASSDVADFDSFLADMVDDSAVYWSGRMEDGVWQDLYYRIVDSGELVSTPCGDAGDPDEYEGAIQGMFCDSDMTIYLSSPWLYDHIWTTGGSTGVNDFGVAYVAAHEVAHAVQHDLGIENPATAATMAPLELQADCLAGVWSHAKYDEDRLDGTDVEEAVVAAAIVSDVDFTSPTHHGTAVERTHAFMVGYDSGDFDRCTLDLPGAY